MSTIGILGAGKLGTVLARLSVGAGHRTLIAASGDPDQIGLLVEVMAPGAIPSWADDAAREADVVILALPLSKVESVPHEHLAGKIVIDAMNYWPSVDGKVPEFETGHATSLIVADALPQSRVVRAFSHLGYHQLDQDARRSGSRDRHAIAIAGDDPDAVEQVAELVDRFGFDPVTAGDLASSALFGPGTALFGTSTSRDEVTQLLNRQEATAGA